ncbi:ribonucleotide reductase [Earliella scabrosa]|nr:ribonucleotide reductase [Earliella scabrosa]
MADRPRSPSTLPNGPHQQCGDQPRQRDRGDLQWPDAWGNWIANRANKSAAIPYVPDDLKEIYRTAWELEPFVMVDMAADRAPYIDQSQSLSLYIDAPNTALLMRLQNWAWEKGLKTGIYYLRTKPPASPIPYGLRFAEQTRHPDDGVLRRAPSLGGRCLLRRTPSLGGGRLVWRRRHCLL